MIFHSYNTVHYQKADFLKFRILYVYLPYFTAYKMHPYFSRSNSGKIVFSIFKHILLKAI
ncbi:hypothetical protein E2C01_041305 [Portunus trituberculatus]|uniref:Uncharacterized protein n=1 Tax=Portunus trituberculatus TaxID=210409 RepID=A0A5B7FQ28_PORTR|nr:hypothetical protein [Portunus trituberculatus]